MVQRLGLLAGVLLLLSGCAARQGCEGWMAINPSRRDVMTPITEAQIIAHNQFGEKQGCWSSGGAK